MTNEIAVKKAGTNDIDVARAEMGLIKDQAAIYLSSGALPATIKNVPQVMMMLQAGKDIGLKPIESLQSFYFVNGRLSLYGAAAISQVLRAGHKIVWGQCNAETATVEIIRGDGKGQHKGTYTMQQAKDRGLTGKDPWKKFPENMLKFKVFHLVSRFICPDALGGHLIVEDLQGGGVESEDVVDITPTEPQQESNAPTREEITAFWVATKKMLIEKKNVNPDDVSSVLNAALENATGGTTMSGITRDQLTAMRDELYAGVEADDNA